MRRRSAFTLIELLVVIAIIAILAVVVVLTLNPAQLLAQSRDANRVSDMATLNSALNLYVTDQAGASTFTLGTSSVAYLSVPDTSGACGNLGLATSSGSFSYACASSTSSRNSNGQGWIPVNFGNISSGSPFGSLPIDPVNQTSSGLLYTYATNGSQFEVTSLLESQKYKVQFANAPQDPGYPEVLAQGSNLAVNPLYNPSGLVGWWPLNEGTGTIASDQSGNQNSGSWAGNLLNGSHYTSGKVGSYAGTFDGSTDSVNVTSSASLNITGPFTTAVWMYIPVATTSYEGLITKYGSCTGGTCGFDMGYYQGTGTLNVRSGSNGNSLTATGGSSLTAGQWHFIVGVFNGSQLMVYMDGVPGGAQSWAYAPGTLTIPITIGSRGGGNFFGGSIDDARIYTRALSAAEITALYNAEK